MDSCQKCGERQWSAMDRTYLKKFGRCWACDRRAWQAKEITTAEFEEREREAARGS